MKMLTPTLLKQSIEAADEIFNRSSNLSDVGAKANIYKERVSYLTSLLGEDGHISFNPVVRKDLSIDFKKYMENSYYLKRYNYYEVMHGTWEEEMKSKNEWLLADALYNCTTNDNLLENKVPKQFASIVERENIDGYRSPKLSKALVKLYGEQSEVVKWFTNKCPKKLDDGVIDDYKVHLSILPHHIAGMSYYAPYNWGGDKWVTGWNYTSCMDTIRNSEGNGIYQLVPNLLDTTLAIAYLTKSDNDDLFHPIYQARLLVRVAKVNTYDFVLLGLRPYYTSNETKHYLIEGLKNRFENFVHVDDLRDYDPVKKSFLTANIPSWIIKSHETACSECGGEGIDDDGYTCYECEGTGTVNNDREFLPYVDDYDFLAFNSQGTMIKLPKDFLIEKGYLEKEKDSSIQAFGTAPLAC